jgi:hypothetical protein
MGVLTKISYILVAGASAEALLLDFVADTTILFVASMILAIIVTALLTLDDVRQALVAGLVASIIIVIFYIIEPVALIYVAIIFFLIMLFYRPKTIKDR